MAEFHTLRSSTSTGRPIAESLILALISVGRPSCKGFSRSILLLIENAPALIDTQNDLCGWGL